MNKEEYNLKFISWNVNGIRAAMGKGFINYFNSTDADLFSLQETKLQKGQITLDLPNYYQYWNYAEKKRSILVRLYLRKKEPISVSYGDRY